MTTREQIEQLVKNYQELIHNPSRELFDKVFSRNALCTEIAGTDCYEGRESVYEDFIIGRLQKRFSRIELIADDLTVHEISDNLVTVIFSYHTDCNLREDGSAFGIAGTETQVIVKEDGAWRIVHVHYSK